MLYSADLEPIAPSFPNIALPEVPDLPIVIPDLPSPLTDLDLVPPPPPPAPPELLSPPPFVPPPPPPPPSDFQTGPTAAKESGPKAPKEKLPPVPDARASLLESIRQAGGSGRAKLKNVTDRKMEVKKKKEVPCLV